MPHIMVPTATWSNSESQAPEGEREPEKVLEHLQHLCYPWSCSEREYVCLSWVSELCIIAARYVWGNSWKKKKSDLKRGKRRPIETLYWCIYKYCMCTHSLSFKHNHHINNKTPTKLLYMQNRPAHNLSLSLLVHSLSTEPKFIVSLTWQVQMESEEYLNVIWGKSAKRIYMRYSVLNVI